MHKKVCVQYRCHNVNKLKKWWCHRDTTISALRFTRRQAAVEEKAQSQSCGLKCARPSVPLRVLQMRLSVWTRSLIAAISLANLIHIEKEGLF